MLINRQRLRVLLDVLAVETVEVVFPPDVVRVGCKLTRDSERLLGGAIIPDRLVRSSAVATAQETRSRSLILSPSEGSIVRSQICAAPAFNCRANPPLKSLPTEFVILLLERGGAEGHAEIRVLGDFVSLASSYP